MTDWVQDGKLQRLTLGGGFITANIQGNETARDVSFSAGLSLGLRNVSEDAAREQALAVLRHRLSLALQELPARPVRWDEHRGVSSARMGQLLGLYVDEKDGRFRASVGGVTMNRRYDTRDQAKKAAVERAREILFEALGNA